MTPLTRYEQETIINFNAGEQTATVYTRDRAVMRKLDRLVAEFPDTYKLTGQTDIDIVNIPLHFFFTKLLRCLPQ